MQKEWKIYTIFETERDTWYQLYLTDAAGPADERLDDYLAVARAHTGQVMDSAAAEAALDRLEAQVGALRQRGQVGGYAPWLVDGKLYDGYTGRAV